MSDKKKGKKGKGGAGRVSLVLFVMALAVLYGIIYLMPTVSDAITQTVVLEYGTIQISQDVKAYIIREEIVYLADRSGTLTYYIDDDMKVRKNVKVLDIALGSAEYAENQYSTILNRLNGVGATPESHYTARNGLVTYFIDGYEGIFTPPLREELRREYVESLEMRIYNVTRNTTLPGEPLYKWVDESKWYVIFWVEPEYIARYAPGGSVTLKLALGDVEGTVDSVTDDEGYGRIILTFDRSYIDFTKQREVEATVVTEDYTGLIVPNSALATEDGVVGVYRKDVSGNYSFVRVDIITSDGEYSLLRTSMYDEDNVKISTVGAYDEVLRDGNDISRRGGN